MLHRPFSSSVTHFLYLNLAATDLLNCFLPSTITTLGLFNNRQLNFLNQTAIDIFGWMLCTLPIISLYMISCIYFARMWAIYRSLTYRAVFTIRRVAIVVTGFWCLGAVYSTLPFICQAHYKYVSEVSIITFSTSKAYLNISDASELLITMVTVTVIDLPLLVVCVCSALSVWTLQKTDASLLGGSLAAIIH